MMIKILVGLAAVIGGFLFYVSTRPGEMFIARETVISASAEVLFPHINNSKKADEWMPWVDSDPEVKMSYSGPEEGVGSKASWNSTGKMGTGEALVVESIPNQAVKTQLTYTKPFTMSQLAEVALTPAPGGTKVRWTVSGQSNFFFRLMGVFIDCEKMIGDDFEKGLSKLKNRVESQGVR